jgi:hypothetical protein
MWSSEPQRLPLGTPGPSQGCSIHHRLISYGMDMWSRLSMQCTAANTAQQRAGHKAGVPLALPQSLPATTEKEQVLHSRDSGVGILSSDQVAVQNNVHSIRLTS